jgi:hypothetical protein
MATNLPEQRAKHDMFATLPPLSGDALRMTAEELRDRVLLLDLGTPVGPVEIARWQRAAAAGQWTAVELAAAVDAVNLSELGFVKTAHVHKHITDRRAWLRAARASCWRHPIAAQLAGEDVELLFERDPRGWRARFEDAVMIRMTDEQWIAWIRENAARFADPA